MNTEEPLNLKDCTSNPLCGGFEDELIRLLTAKKIEQNNKVGCKVSNVYDIVAECCAADDYTFAAATVAAGFVAITSGCNIWSQFKHNQLEEKCEEEQRQKWEEDVKIREEKIKKWEEVGEEQRQKWEEEEKEERRKWEEDEYDGENEVSKKWEEAGEEQRQKWKEEEEEEEIIKCEKAGEEQRQKWEEEKERRKWESFLLNNLLIIPTTAAASTVVVAVGYNMWLRFKKKYIL